MSKQDKLTPGARAPTDVLERRAAARFASVREASCSPLAERQTVLPVRVRDVSANGIGLVSRRRFERGTILLLQVKEEGDASSPLLIGKVVHVTAQADGDWLVGCALIRALAQADLRALADEAVDVD